jgi:hypothetical protein
MIKMRNHLILIVACAAPFPSLADQCAKSPVFYFEIKDVGKHVRLCESDVDINHRYGRVGDEAELELAVKRSAAVVTHWHGFGDDYWASLELPNGRWSFRLTVSYERGTEET